MLKLLKYILVPKSHLLVFVRNNFWSKLFVWLTIFLAILAVFSIWGANFLERIVDPVKSIRNDQVILEVYPESNTEATSSKQHIIEQYLQNNAHIADYKVVPPQELKSSLHDWLVVFDKVNNYISLPIIINIRLTDSASYGANDLQMSLSEKVSNVYAQPAVNLANKLTSTLDLSKNLLLSILLVLVFIVFAVVLFATLGLVYSQRESLEVVSFLGASYGALAKEMAIWIFKYSLIGCLIGVSVALIAVQIGSLCYYTGSLVMPSETTVWLTLLVMVFIPLESTIIALICVRRVLTWIF